MVRGLTLYGGRVRLPSEAGACLGGLGAANLKLTSTLPAKQGFSAVPHDLDIIYHFHSLLFFFRNGTSRRGSLSFRCAI